MAVAALKIKLMPESLETNLEELKKKAGEKILKLKGMNISFSEENIAFGLKAIIVMLAWPEEQDTGISGRFADSGGRMAPASPF